MKQEIEQFFNFIKIMQVSINSLVGDTFLVNQQKALLLNLLESLAKTKYPTLGNGARFKQLLLDDCKWDHAQHISIQQLMMALKKTSNSKIENKSNIIEWLNNILIYKFQPGAGMPLSYDVTIEEFKEKFPYENYLSEKILTNFTHSNLLWKYRNTLIHEAYSKDSKDVFTHDYPHYIHYTIIKPERNVQFWKICYPVSFLNLLIDNAITNLRDHFLVEDIDPTNVYDFSEQWIKF